MRLLRLVTAGTVATILATMSPAFGDTLQVGRVEFGGGAGLCGPIGDLNRSANLGATFPATLGVRVAHRLVVGAEYAESDFSTPDFLKMAELFANGLVLERTVTRAGVWARYLFPRTSEREAGQGHAGFYVSGGAGLYKVKWDFSYRGTTLFNESKPGFGLNIGGGVYLFAKTRRVLEGWGLIAGVSLHHVQLDEPYSIDPAPAGYTDTASGATFAELNIIFTAYLGK